MSQRIVLLTTESRVAQALAQQVALIQAELVMIVIESQPRNFHYSPLSQFARHILGDRMVNMVSMLRLPAPVRRMLRAEDRLWKAADKEFDGHLKRMGVTPRWPTDIPVYHTASINDEATVARVREAKPDLIVVFATRILKAPMIAAARMGAVNAHSSLLPAYRGMRSEFWQCYLNDPAYVGLTVHVVNTGVDTGDILFSKATETPWPTDPFLLRMRNNLSILENYPRVVQDHLDHRSQPRPQGVSAQPTYRGRDITVEKRIELIERLARE